MNTLTSVEVKQVIVTAKVFIKETNVGQSNVATITEKDT